MANLAPPLSGRLGYPLGFAAAIVVTEIAVAADGTAHPWLPLTALTVTVFAVAAVTAFSAALAAAAFSWGLFAGFVVGRHGELAFTWASAAAAALLLLAAALGYGVMLLIRR